MPGARQRWEGSEEGRGLDPQFFCFSFFPQGHPQSYNLELINTLFKWHLSAFITSFIVCFYFPFCVHLFTFLSIGLSS